jgi:hypothetical protein
MSDIKPKRKRSQLSTMVDFLSPFTPDQCLARLQSSESPLDKYSQVMITKNEDGWNISFQYENNVAPVWFSGQLETAFDGTWIRGQIRHKHPAIDDPELLVLWGLASFVILGLAYVDIISQMLALVLVSLSFMLLLPLLLALINPESSEELEEDAEWISNWLHTELGQ